MPLQKPSRLGVLPALVTLVLTSALAASCTNDFRDSHCDAESPDDVDCTSNPDGLGPDASEPLCALPAASEPVPPNCGDYGFEQVYAFMLDPLKGNCFAAGCHGSEGTAAIGVFLRPLLPSGADDLCRTYSTLKTTSGAIGTPYVVEDVLATDGITPVEPNEALASWMYCNVAGLPGGSFPMPKPGGTPVKEDAELVRNWILCGAHGPTTVTCTEPTVP